MTSLTLTMPRLGETMEEGVIHRWLVSPGQDFKRGQPILELETDKTMVEFPALGDGVIDETLAVAGDRIGVGKPIARARVVNAAEWGEDSDEPVAAGPAILRMPRLGETMDEGIIVQWLVAEGATYARGDAILEIETDKTVAEFPALYEGRLLRILAQPGEKLDVGAPIAEVEGQVETPEIVPETVPVAEVAVTVATPRNVGEKLRATPVARKIARQLGIALDGVTGTGRRGRIERTDVERRGSSELNWLSLSDGQLAYSVVGDTGHSYVLVHGFSGDRTTWAQLSTAIARAGHRAIVPDLPGHGATTAEAYGIDTLVDAVTRLAETLPTPITLVGHSLGAAVATIAAERLGSKVARLVLVTPAGCGPTIGADFVHGMAHAQTAGEIAHLLRLLGPKGGALSDVALSQMSAETSKGRLRVLADALTTSLGRQRIDILRPLARMTVPVTAIFGTDDRVVTATDALNLPSRVGVHFMPTGHMPQWDDPREFAALVLNGGQNG